MSVLPEQPVTPATEQPSEVSAPPASQGEHMIPKTRLDEEIAKRKLMESQLQELERLQAEEKKRADAQPSETERLQKERDEIKAENAKIKSDLLRREVVDEVGLPATFATRLQGSTKEELLADAKELAKTLPQLKVAPKVPVTNPANGTTVNTEQELRAKLWGGSNTRLDRESIEKLGGGVVINGKNL